MVACSKIVFARKLPTWNQKQKKKSLHKKEHKNLFVVPLSKYLRENVHKNQAKDKESEEKKTNSKFLW